MAEDKWNEDPPPNQEWVNKLVHELRVKNPPNGNGWKNYQTIIAALMTISFGFLGAAYWRSTDAAAETAKMALDAKNLAEGIQKDRTARIADLDRWRDGTEKELQTYRVGYSDFRKLEGVVGQLADKLDNGRSERLSDRDKMVDAINSLKTEVALLRQSVEARGRKADDAPFLQRPFLILPTIDRRPPIYRDARADMGWLRGE